MKRSAQGRVPDFGVGVYVDGKQKENALQVVAFDSNVQKVKTLVVVLLCGRGHSVEDGLCRLVVAAGECRCKGSQTLLVTH